MVALKVEWQGNDPVLVLTDEAKDLLRADPARLLLFEGSADQGFTLADAELAIDDRRERGHAFLQRYRKTFEALAK